MPPPAGKYSNRAPGHSHSNPRPHTCDDRIYTSLVSRATHWSSCELVSYVQLFGICTHIRICKHVAARYCMSMCAYNCATTYIQLIQIPNPGSVPQHCFRNASHPLGAAGKKRNPDTPWCTYNTPWCTGPLVTGVGRPTSRIPQMKSL
jgi:hypothetical protein